MEKAVNTHPCGLGQTSLSCIKEHILRMEAYKPPLEGRDPEIHLLLDFNERTMPVAQHINRAILDFINQNQLMVYPKYGHVSASIAAYAQVKPSQTLCTNGSDQGIDLVLGATTVSGDEILIPTPSFAMYWQTAQIQGLSIVEIPYTDDFRFPIEDLKKTISQKTKVIIVSNPNNPTGTLVSETAILELARANPHTAIMVDECYFEYSKTTVKDYIEEFYSFCEPSQKPGA